MVSVFLPGGLEGQQYGMCHYYAVADHAGGDARGICFLKVGGFPVFYAKQSPKVLLFPKIFLP